MKVALEDFARNGHTKISKRGDSMAYYRYTYTFEVGKGETPAERLDQDFYDISSTDKISRYGTIEKVKKGDL